MKIKEKTKKKRRQDNFMRLFVTYMRMIGPYNCVQKCVYVRSCLFKFPLFVSHIIKESDNLN